MKEIAIIGVGLIGGSLGLAIKERGLAERVTGIGRREESLKKALRLGAVDKITLSLKDGVKGADFVIVCTPVKTIPPIVSEISAVLSKGAIITDVGSTKAWLVAEIGKGVPQRISFVGSHPLTGSEKSGVEAAREDLFVGSVCVLTPDEKTSLKALETVGSFWENVGAKTIVMNPDKHDFIVAATSHLPHLAAVAMVSLIEALEENRGEILPLIATGFKGTTRIALSPSEMWKDICLTNGENIASMIEKFQNLLEKIKGHILKRESDLLQEKLDKARAFRSQM
jgi:prephenate dehydrogenase